MELDSCLKGRRSVRAYTKEPVSKEHVEAILEAGTWAPTAMNHQPLRFIIIEDKDLIKYVSDETKHLTGEIIPQMKGQFSTSEDVICYSAPMLILVCTEKMRNSASQTFSTAF